MNDGYGCIADEKIQTMPWLLKDAGPGEQEKQRNWHDRIKKETNCTMHETAFFSREAYPAFDRLVLGKDFFIASRCIVRGNVEMGNHSSFNCGVITIGNMKIGDYVRIASYTQIMGFNHNHGRTDIPTHDQGISRRV
ncbi:MAG: acyltransferase [Spirochaetia bacterium]